MNRWGLSSLELCIMSMFLSSLPPSSCRDIPIYLPKASNKVAHRLIILTLLEGIILETYLLDLITRPPQSLCVRY